MFFELHRIECRHIFAGWNTNGLDDGVERIRALLDGKDVHELLGPWQLEPAPNVYLKVVAEGFFYTWDGRR